MSNNNLPFLVFLIPLAIGIPVVLWSLRYAKKRTEDLGQIAQQMGFRFLGRMWRGPVLSPAHKICLIQRTRGRFNNALTGAVGGLDVTVSDYTYPMGKSTVTLTLAALVHDRQLPPFELRSENIFDRIGEAFVHNDIDFDSNPEFSKRYFLRSPDEEGARRLFTPGLQAYFQQIPPDRQWHVETSANTLVLYRFPQLVTPAEIPHFLDETSAIARAILDAAR